MKTYRPTMQCNSKTISNVPNVYLWPYHLAHVLSLNYHRSIAWSVTNQTLPQLINISHRMLTYPLLYHCKDSVINKTEVAYVKKPQVWCYHVSLASCDESLRVERTRCAGALCCWNLSWFSAFDFRNNTINAYDRKFIEVYTCRKLSK